MENGNDANTKKPSHGKRPYATMGAGELVSSLWKEGEECGGWSYRFNLFRMSSSSGQVDQMFQPRDVADLVKLMRVLMFALVDDGCLAPELRDDLACLMSCLDDILGEPKSYRPGLLRAYEVDALAGLVAYVWENECRHFEDRPMDCPIFLNVSMLRRWLEDNRQCGGPIHHSLSDNRAPA